MKNMLIEPKYKGIVFDLDGTLADTIEDLTDSLNMMLDYYGLLPKTYDEGRRLVGHGLRDLVKKSLPRKMFRNKKMVDEALARMKDEYTRRYISKTRPFPGVPELLEYCQRHEIPIAVNTNKPDEPANYIVNRLFPDIHFTIIQGQREDVPKKPDPTGVLEIVKQMGLKPEECIYMGDSEVDHDTAINAGMMPVLVTYGYTPAEKIKQFEDSIWIKEPHAAIGALKYGTDLYSLFQEDPKKII